MLKFPGSNLSRVRETHFRILFNKGKWSRMWLAVEQVGEDIHQTAVNEYGQSENERWCVILDAFNRIEEEIEIVHIGNQAF